MDAHARGWPTGALIGLLSGGVAIGVGQLAAAVVGAGTSPLFAVGSTGDRRDAGVVEELRDPHVRHRGQDGAPRRDGDRPGDRRVVLGIVSLRRPLAGVIGLLVLGTIGAVAAVDSTRQRPRRGDPGRCRHARRPRDVRVAPRACGPRADRRDAGAGTPDAGRLRPSAVPLGKRRDGRPRADDGVRRGVPGAPVGRERLPRGDRAPARRRRRAPDACRRGSRRPGRAAVHHPERRLLPGRHRVARARGEGRRVDPHDRRHGRPAARRSTSSSSSPGR